MFDRTRRRLLATAVLAVAALRFGARASAAASAGADAVTPTVALCRFLTGWQGLDARVVSRALAALTAASPGFEDRARSLWQRMTAAGLQTVAEFRSSALYQEPLNRDTAGRLVSALYLGCVGEGDAAALVSYEAALMFAPTQDVTPIPSYAIGGPAYWGATD